MRIIAGKYKRQRIEYPKAKAVVRPTMDRVKESMFNMVSPGLEGTTCLSIFSGSGSLGLEALSRGAKSVVFVDSYHASIIVIRNNISRLGIPADAVEIFQMDALRAIERFSRENRRFEYVFIDPPYHKDYIKKTLLKLECFDILAPDSYLVIEHSKEEQIPPSDLFYPIKTKRFGATLITICRKGAQS